MIGRPSCFLLFFQNGRNKAIFEGIKKIHPGAIQEGKQTAEISKMFLGPLFLPIFVLRLNSEALSNINFTL